MPTSLRIVQKFFPEVTSVTDAKRRVSVEVTKRDTNSATVKNHKACAMAVACQRKFKATGVIISRSTAYLVTGDKAVRYHVPNSVSREVISFDRGAGFEEGEYQLSKPPKTPVYHGVKPGKGKGHQGGSDENRVFQHETTNVRTVPEKQKESGLTS
jgi:hypothetical protein